MGLIYYEVPEMKKRIDDSIELYEKSAIYDRNNYLAYYSLAVALEEQVKLTND